MKEYDRGWRDGMRWAATWLYNFATTRSDPNAKSIINGAAWGLTVDGKEAQPIDTNPGGAKRMRHYAEREEKRKRHETAPNPRTDGE